MKSKKMTIRGWHASSSDSWDWMVCAYCGTSVEAKQPWKSSSPSRRLRPVAEAGCSEANCLAENVETMLFGSAQSSCSLKFSRVRRHLYANVLRNIQASATNFLMELLPAEWLASCLRWFCSYSYWRTAMWRSLFSELNLRITRRATADHIVNKEADASDNVTLLCFDNLLWQWQNRITFALST